MIRKYSKIAIARDIMIIGINSEKSEINVTD